MTICFVIEKIVGNHVLKDVEIEGLDLPEMGAPGYSGMIRDRKTGTPVV